MVIALCSGGQRLATAGPAALQEAALVPSLHLNMINDKNDCDVDGISNVYMYHLTVTG